MKSFKTLYDEKVQSMAQDLSQKGYEVLIEPSNSQLPFDLEGYNPDLIARKNNEGIIVEIKGNLKHLSVDKFQNIAQRIASHDGWRFILVPIEKQDEEIIQNNLPS